MSNTKIPPVTLAAFWSTIVAGNPIKVAAVSSSFVWSDAFDFFNDVTGQLGSSSAALTGVTYTNGQLNADSTTISGITVGQVVTGLIIYADTGTPSTSRLLAFIDTNADGTAMSITSDGTTGTITWPIIPIASI